MDVSRRTFLQTAATVAATALLPRSLQGADDAPAGLVGSQLYGWGQYYAREGKTLAANLGEALSALRDAGYDYAEHNLGSPEESAKLAEELKARKMRPVCLYTGGRLHDEAQADKTIKSLLERATGAKAAGFRIINCNPDAVGRPKTAAELATQAKALQTLGAELNALGLKFGIHHHTPEFQEKGKEFHSNFENTDAKTVGFCYDVDWVLRGGVTPEDALLTYGPRIVSWHLRQSRKKVWWEDLADGDIDYAYVALQVKEKRLARIFSVELAIENGTKITRTVVENHARSREFVRQVFEV